MRIQSAQDLEIISMILSFVFSYPIVPETGYQDTEHWCCCHSNQYPAPGDNSFHDCYTYSSNNHLESLITVRLRSRFPVLIMKTDIGKSDVGGSVSG